jgi:GT2 family glycosyltransferase
LVRDQVIDYPPCVVIVVNYNSGTLLRRNLESIRSYAPGCRAIVVDNASSDGSQRVASLSEPGLRLVVNASNVGFAKAINQAMTLCDEPYVLLLNPDARLQRGALEALAAELDGHPECGIAAPRILDEDGGIQGSVRGDPNLLTGLFGRSSLLTRVFPASPLSKRNVPRHPSNTSVEVDWVSGACMLCRRTALDMVRGFDERYFLYWEDADLCRRLRSRGITIRYVPASEVVHAGGQSSRTAQGLAIRAFHSSAYTYYATHVARTALGRSLAWIVLEARCRLKLLSSHSLES